MRFHMALGLIFLLLRTPSISALWNGELAIDNQFPAAVSFSSCSGVRVGQRHILTAAHCVYEQAKFLRNGTKVDGDLIGDYRSGEKLVISHGVNPQENKSAPLEIFKTHIHPSYLNIDTKEDTEHTADIALIEFKEELSLEIAIAQISPEKIYPNKLVTLAGFGLTAPGIFSQQILFGNVITSGISELLKPLRFGESTVSFLEEHHYLVAGSGRSFPMEGDLPLLGKGDSGGAVYDSRDPNNLTVIGINSMANILGAGSYIARLDEECPLGTFQWLNDLLLP